MFVPLIAALLAAVALPPIVLDGSQPPPAKADAKDAVFDPLVPLPGAARWASFDEGYRCTVERTFGGTPAAVALKLARSAIPNGTEGNLLLVRRLIPYRYNRTLAIDFHDGRPPMDLAVNNYSLPRQAVTMFRFWGDPHEFWPRWDAAGSVTFSYGKEPVATVSLAGGAEAARIAGECARKQMLAAGGTAAEAAAWLGETPSLTDQGWKLPRGGRQPNLFFDEDYPAAAREKGIGGRTLIAYRVAPDGKPAACRVVKSSRNRDLDDASCDILVRRVTFNPPLDPAGRPTTLIGSTWINWSMPSDADYLAGGYVGGFIGAGQGGSNVN